MFALRTKLLHPRDDNSAPLGKILSCYKIWTFVFHEFSFFFPRSPYTFDEEDNADNLIKREKSGVQFPAEVGKADNRRGRKM